MSMIRTLARTAMIRAGIHEKDLRNKLIRSGNRIIFLFHRVLPAERGCDLSPGGMVVSVETFRRFLDWLPGRFETPSPEDFLASWPEPAARPAALITFDDGWLDVVDHALPEMSRRQLPGICFVTPRFVEGGGLFWPERLVHHILHTRASVFRAVTGREPPPPGDADRLEELLNAWKGITDADREEMLGTLSREGEGEPEGRRIAGWEELRTLRDGGVEIGSHGMSHQLLTRLTEEEARAEIVDSRIRIGEMLGREPRSIAYPNGDRDRIVRRLAREAGYSFGFSLKGSWEERYDLPRINLHERSMRDEKLLIWALGRGR